MKFEKRLRTEIVPEWKTKYIDYKGLKKRLRTIQQAKVAREKELARESNYNSRARSPDLESPFLQNNNKRHSFQSLQSQQQRTFSMTSIASSFFHKVSSALISIQKQQNLHAPPPQIKSLDTLMDQVDPEERLFFVALDKELAKIEAFCEVKEKEASNRMNLLIQQYEILKEEKERRPAKSRRNTRTFVKESFDYIKSSSTVNFEKPEPEKQPMDYETARKIIKKAVFEFYRGVELLKNYCVLNYIGFVKLLKKYDKVSERNGYKIYMQKVTKCYNVKFSQIKNLLKEAEDFYVNHFESGSRSRAIRKLRLPNKEHKTYYSSVLRIGLYLGLALPIAIYSLNYAWDKPTTGELLLYSGLVLPILLFLLLGINMYTWTRSHINYKFIFELDPRDNLDFRQYLELPAIFLLALSFTIYFNYIYNISGILPRVYPILFAIFICAVVFNPFPILYYNARRWFVFSMARLLGSGILRVEFRDFFIADGLTSLSYSLTMFQLFGRDGKYIFIGGDARDNYDKYDTSVSLITPFLGSIPAFLRLLQCFKRYRDTYQVHHLINLFKYLSIILAIFMASWYSKTKATSNNGNVMLFSWLFTQSFASIYTFGWDVKMDWSLFKMHSVNYLLRDELGYEHRWIYYGAIVSNFILRWSWVITVIIPHKPLVWFFVALGEMLRRWQWNFFRVENEHINNCEQNRAVKEIPLPYRTEADIIMPEEFETGSVDVESDFDRTSSFTSWRRKLFTANKSKSSTADNLRDFEPRKNAPEYIYENIYEESDDDSDGIDDYDEVYGTNTRRSKTISIIRAEGTHGLSNAYASRSFLPIIE